MAKIKSFFKKIKEHDQEKRAALATAYANLWADCPFTAGVIVGQAYCYWFIVLGALIMSLIRGRRQVWTLVDKK